MKQLSVAAILLALSAHSAGASARIVFGRYRSGLDSSVQRDG